MVHSPLSPPAQLLEPGNNRVFYDMQGNQASLNILIISKKGKTH